MESCWLPLALLTKGQLRHSITARIPTSFLRLVLWRRKNCGLERNGRLSLRTPFSVLTPRSMSSSIAFSMESRMNSKVEIRAALEEARANTLRLIADVNEEDFRRQIHPDFSPLGWHLGHIGVTEAYWILQQCKQEPSPSAFYDFF